MPSQRDDPYRNFRFVVDLGQSGEVGFSEAELPSGEVEVIHYREGAERSTAARKLPGRTTYPNVRLRRGLGGRTELYEWWSSARDGDVQRRNVSIVLTNEQREPVQRWVLRNAWPTKLEFSGLDALGNDVVIETLELAHDGFDTETF